MDRVYPEVRVRKSAIAPAFCLRPRNRRIICHTWFLFAVRSHGDEQRILHHWSHRRRGRRPEVVWPLLTEHDPDAVRSSPHTILCRRALIRLFPRSVKWTGRRDSHPDGLRHLQPVIYSVQPGRRLSQQTGKNLVPSSAGDLRLPRFERFANPPLRVIRKVQRVVNPPRAVVVPEVVVRVVVRDSNGWCAHDAFVVFDFDLRIEERAPTALLETDRSNPLSRTRTSVRKNQAPRRLLVRLPDLRFHRPLLMLGAGYASRGRMHVENLS